MDVKKILFIAILILLALSQSCFSIITNDWICIPGQRVGPINKEINEKALIKIFGASNIKTIQVSPDEELGTPGETFTYVFPNTKNEIKIRWKEQKPWIISIYKKGTQWKTIEGITVGSSLNELIKINKKDFVLAGYGWEYSGWVSSWNNGELSKYKGKLDIFFDEGDGTLRGEEFIGNERRIKTDNKQLLKAKPKVKTINIVF